MNVSGLRILLTCFRDSLKKEWLNIAATIRYFISYLFIYLSNFVNIIRKYGDECGEWSVALWRLLDYIDLYRTPLYVMLLRCSAIIYYYHNSYLHQFHPRTGEAQSRGQSRGGQPQQEPPGGLPQLRAGGAQTGGGQAEARSDKIFLTLKTFLTSNSDCR